ncbi:MAG TPA: DUF5724 domain-containing protein, partial [Anaerolineae bacterium]
MLRREEAQVQLLSFQVNDWPADRVAAGRELPEPLATLAFALLRRDAAGDSTRGKAGTGYSQADMARLDQLEPSERQQVFAAVFGSRLAPHVERAWQIGKRGPYSYGGWRRPFRAPEDPSLTLPARSHWLDSLLRVVGVYEPDLAWAAAWAPYLTWYGGDPIGLLCAAAIEEGGAEGSQTYEILCASAQGEHPIGAMGRHVTRALLTANYPPGWDYIERLLLAAQRQEGVRQAILETIDEAHPDAFRRMLRLILDHDLTRYAATVRAADVWLGLSWNVNDIRLVKEALACLLRHLDAAASGEPLPVEGTPQERYLGLWAAAYQNAPAAIPLSEAHLRSTDVEQRFAAVHLLGQLNVEPASRALATALEDPDLRVATWAVAGIWRKAAEPGIFERLEALLPRFPAKTQPVTAPVWPWLRLEIGQPVIADALTRFLGDRSPERLLPYLPLLDAVGRAQAVRLFVTQKPQGPGTRRALITLAGDGFSYVRQEATRALAESRILPAEAPDLEGLLTRKPADLRASVLGLLLGQPDQAALASGQRLLARRDARQRMAGLDLLRQMVEHRRLATECREVARAYSAARPQLVPAEEERLQILCREEELEVVTLVDGLGLLDPAGRTRPPELRPTRRRGPFRVREAALVTDAAVSCLQSLDAWIHEHRAEPVTVRDHLDKEREELLGNLIWAFPSPNPRLKPEEDLANLPLAEAWEVWWQERPAAARDADGLELVRAQACFLREHWNRQAEKTAWLGPLLTTLFGEGITESLRYGGMIVRLLPWFWRRHPAIGTADFLLDCLERSLALIPEDKRTKPDEWRNYNGILGWQDVARTHRDVCSGEWSPAHQARFWRLLRWIDEPAAGCPRRRPQMTELLAAYEAGAATRDDLLDQLIGFREENSRGFHQFTDLHQNSGRQPTDLVERHPIVGELVQRCRERVLEVELKRGDLPTPASLPALALRWTGGMHAVLPLIKALGQDAFARGYLYAGQSRSAVLSHLIRATTPLADNTPEAFALAAQAAGIGPRRLVELAVYAPQWARHVEQTLKWPGFTEAVWWLYAHTKDGGWTVDAELRELWQAQVAQHTGLTGQELMDGAVDVQWFHRAYGTLGAERWGEVYRAALYASGGLGHKRAQLFADAMLGQIPREVICSRVKDKRQGDAVRSLGLLPLSHEDRAEEIQARYAVIQGFLRTSRQYGSQRQASEK